MKIAADNVGKLALLGVIALFMSSTAISDEFGHQHGRSEHHKEEPADTKHGYFCSTQALSCCGIRIGQVETKL